MRRWHRRLGATLGLVAILLAVTGILLNHAQQLRLDRTLIQNPLLLAWYDIELPEPVAFAVGDQWISHWGSNQLYFQGREVAFCEAPLSGAVVWQNQIVVACGDALVLLTQEGTFIERIGDIYQLPVPVTGLAVAEFLYLKARDTVYRVDLDELRWAPVDISPVFVSPQPLPEKMASRIHSQVAAAELTLERVLADIHSGRILGTAGVWLADLAAIGLVFLGISGLWMWWRQMRRH